MSQISVKGYLGFYFINDTLQILKKGIIMTKKYSKSIPLTYEMKHRMKDLIKEKQFSRKYIADNTG